MSSLTTPTYLIDAISLGNLSHVNLYIVYTHNIYKTANFILIVKTLKSRLFVVD